MRYIIIGGVAGGASFACRLRRLDEKAEIIIYEKSNFVSYANCGLPYYISSTIDSKSKLTLQTPASLKARFNIDVYVNSEVTKIDRKNHKIEIKNLKTNETIIDTYDKLVISTGAEAFKIAPLGERIFELKTVEDSLKLKDFIDEEKVKSAIIIGGGFIGLEIAENLVKKGIKVTLLEGANHCLANLDKEMASFVHDELKLYGVNLKLKSMVKEVKEENDKVVVKYNDETLASDILIQAIGVKPASDLAKNAGLDLDIKGAIKVDNNFKTSDEDIFAIGDVTAIHSFIDDSISYIPLAGLANKEGRELATHLITKKDTEIKALGTSILKIFSLAVASTGFNEETLKRKNIPYNKIYLCPANHATYYPNSSMLNIKLIFSPDDYRILGAQIVGKDGVDKRIDLLAFAIKFNVKAYDLTKLELSYAPPFSSAKDPLNMAGYMVENLKEGLVKQFFAEDVENMVKDKTNYFVDVRTKMEYDLGHIDGSINIPLDELRNHLDELPIDKHICLICQSALRSYIGSRILSQNGFNVSHLAGGFRFYTQYLKD